MALKMIVAAMLMTGTVGAASAQDVPLDPSALLNAAEVGARDMPTPTAEAVAALAVGHRHSWHRHERREGAVVSHGPQVCDAHSRCYDADDICGKSEFDAYSDSEDLSSREGGPGWINFDKQKDFSELNGDDSVELYVECQDLTVEANGLLSRIRTERDETILYKYGAALVDVTERRGTARSAWSPVACTLARTLPGNSLLLVPHYVEEYVGGDPRIGTPRPVNQAYVIRAYGVRIFSAASVAESCSK
ncbi:MAG: hypothetical protein ACHQ49_09520 [Elusimicrobiota bacterium]